MSTFHYLARAVILDDGYVLTARERVGEHFFLPGGHIEFGEAAKHALKREIYEELGVESTIGEFIGALEHRWPENIFSHHEINLLFHVNASGLVFSKTPVSIEEHLEFRWVSLKDLSHINLQPYPLKKVLLGCVEGVVWESTME